MSGDFVKIIGVKFDILNGLEVIHDFNQKNFSEAGKIVDEESDPDTIYIGIPCSYLINIIDIFKKLTLLDWMGLGNRRYRMVL